MGAAALMTSSKLGLFISAMNRSPALSTATPVGMFRPEITVFAGPDTGTSITLLAPESAMNKSPSLSTARPSGWLRPEATML